METQNINNIFALVLDSKVAEIQAEEERLANQKQEGQKLMMEQHIRNQKLSSEIRDVAQRVQKFISEVFAEPSELSEFLEKNVLASHYSYALMTRFTGSWKKEKKVIVLGIAEGESGVFPKASFRVVTLCQFKTSTVSVDGKDRDYYLGLAFPNDERLPLSIVDLVAFNKEHDPNSHWEPREISLMGPPAEPALLEKLQELNCNTEILCDWILERHKHLITP